VAQAVAAFRAGQADFLEQGQPVVEQLLVDGTGHLVASMGEATGPVPFSSYMTTPRFLREQGDILRRFTRGLFRAQEWLARQSGAIIADLIAPSFPDIDRALSTRAIDRYLNQDTWARDPILRQAGYDYLQSILREGGFIHSSHRYEDLVDTSIARQVTEAAR
jgi:NitT/TauT family transport system substrate-binding protein